MNSYLGIFYRNFPTDDSDDVVDLISSLWSLHNSDVDWKFQNSILLWFSDEEKLKNS